MLKRVGTMLVAAASLAACSESMIPTEPAVPTGTTQAPISADQSVLARLTCRVDVAANSMSCAPESPTSVAGRSSNLILGGQNVYVKTANTVPVNNGTTITTSLTVQNLSAQPWGTTDGTTPEGTGVRVFFLTPPTSPVTSNAPFTGTFTAANQKYFQYSGSDLGGDGILSPGETSLGQTWVFTLNGASTFTFQLLISTAMPAEQGVLRWIRGTGVAGGAYLNAVWGSASNDVWAAGQTGTFSHWTGTAWSSVAGAASTDVNSIWGSSASNVMAVGGGGDIQRFNGTSWSLQSNVGAALYGVWGSSASDIWAVGLAGLVVHYDGTAWSNWATNISATPNLADVWSTGPTNVYAVGGTALWQYTASSGTSWQVIDVSAANPSAQQFRAIWGSSATDIWVAGTSGFLMRLVSGTWTQQASLGSGTITSLSGTGANDVYAVNSVGQIWHWNGASWVVLNNSSSLLYGVWAGGTRDVWAVGTVDFSTNLTLHGIR